MKSAVFAFGILLTFAAGPAAAQTAPPTQVTKECQVIRAEGASYLAQCGSELHSFTMSLLNYGMEVSNDPHGRISFHCPAQFMCANEPRIGAKFVSVSH